MNDLFKLLNLFYKDNKFKLIIYIVLLLIVNPLTYIVEPRILSGFFKDVKSSSTNDFYYKYFGYALFIYLIMYTGYYFIDNIQSEILPKFEKFIHDTIYKHILNKYQYHYELPNIADLLHKMNTVPFSITGTIKLFVNNILPQVITIICIICYFFYINKTIGCTLLSFLIIYCVIMKRYFNKCKILSMKVENNIKEKENIFNDKFQNLFSIYSNGKLHDEVHENKGVTENFRNNAEQNMKCGNSITRYNLYYNLFIMLSLLVLSVIMFRKDKISHVVLISIILTITWIPENINSVGTSVESLIDKFSILNIHKDFISDMYNNISDDKKEKINITNGHISIKNISFGYQGKENIFTDFSLEIPAKQKIAILGKSGRGKSTLIKLITGYYKLNKGSILIDNTDISSVDLNDLRKNIGYVSQNNILFNKTVWENIGYGNDKSKEYIQNLINSLSININLDDSVGIMGDKLSGGQKQMVHILRAICKQNKIVILDEPTSSIDTVNKDIIINAIKQLSINSTVILITHDKDILGLFDKQFNLNLN